MTNNQKIPKIRFPEFSWEWEEKKLMDFTKINQWLQIAISERFTEKIPDSFFYITNEFLREWNTWKVVTWVEGAFHNNFFKIKYDKDIISKKFLYFFLTSNKTQNKILSLAWTSTIPDLNHWDFYKLKINLPSLPEQEKIANYLSSVEKKIELLEEEKKNTEEYKKWVMQKIFSQELRFKDENWEEFGEWEEKILDNIWKSYNWLTWKTSEDFWKWSPFITYKQIFDNSKIDIKKFDFVNITTEDKQNKAKYWDAFFTVSSETPNEIWFSSMLLDDIDNLYLNSFCFWFRPNSLDELYPIFLRFFFRSEIFRKEVIKLAQWSTRYNMSKLWFMKMKFYFPTFEEQEKIANFLSKIDDKIEFIDKKLEETKEFKKGLLQNMFV